MFYKMVSVILWPMLQVNAFLFLCTIVVVDRTNPNDEEDLEWFGFKLVGDNIDKNVKPRDIRFSNQTTSLHYFHVYAVKDRISFKHLNSSPPLITSDDIDFNVFFPAPADNEKLVANFQILMTRMLVHYLPGLQTLSAGTNHHILHKYSRNMSLKSNVVSDCSL